MELLEDLRFIEINSASQEFSNAKDQRSLALLVNEQWGVILGQKVQKLLKIAKIRNFWWFLSFSKANNSVTNKARDLWSVAF